MHERSRSMNVPTYNIKWNPNPPLRLGQLVTFAVAAGIAIVTAWLGVIGLPVGVLGVSAFYIAMGFLIPFGMWFSGWGLLMAALAGWASLVLSGTPLAVALVTGLADPLGLIPIWLFYRVTAPRLGLDQMGKDVYTSKAIWYFFLITVLSRFLSSVWGNGSLYLFGLMPAAALPLGFLGWFLGDVIVVMVISPVLLRTLSPVLERLGLTVKGVVT
jgi:hypothetical protein